MKKLFLIAMFQSFALATLQAGAAPTTTLTFVGPVTLSWSITQQATTSVLSSMTTNHTGKGTNAVTNIYSTYKSSTTNFSKFGNANFLKLLSNSLALKTNFPAGTQLATDGRNLFLVDKSGTNIVQSISSVVTVEVFDSLESGSVYDQKVIKHSGTTTLSPGYSDTQTRFELLRYNDSSLTTGDGTHTSFYFTGVATLVNDVSLGSTTGKATLTLSEGGGAGTIRGVASIITGSITGKPAGVDTDE